MARLSGKVAMITGCGGEHGIGQGIARRLAADGADLVLTDIEPQGIRIVSSKPDTGWGGLEAVADEVQALGQRAITVLLDIRSAAQIEHVTDKALEVFGRLDILVNNAAAPPGADRVPVVQLSEEAWDTVLETNLKGSFLCAKAAATIMLRQKILGISPSAQRSPRLMRRQWAQKSRKYRPAMALSELHGPVKEFGFSLRPWRALRETVFFALGLELVPATKPPPTNRQVSGEIAKIAKTQWFRFGWLLRGLCALCG